jgi:hypothetical protein
VSRSAPHLRWLSGQLVAVALGILSGASAATIYYLSYDLLFVTAADVFPVALKFGVVIAGLSAPAWALIAWLNRDSAIAAALLGFVATALVVNAGIMSATTSWAERAESLPFALCGAAAGLVTYFVGRFTAARAPRPTAGTAPRPSA